MELKKQIFVKILGRVLTLEVNEDIIDIYENGFWVGCGRWDAKYKVILNCCAKFSSSYKENAEFYSGIDKVIRESTRGFGSRVPRDFSQTSSVTN